MVVVAAVVIVFWPWCFGAGVLVVVFGSSWWLYSRGIYWYCARGIMLLLIAVL